MTWIGRRPGRHRRLRFAAGLAIVSAAAAGCRDGLDRLRAGAAGAGEEAGASRHVVTIEGFDSPESVTYDPELDVYYVSSMRLFGSLKDDNGFISRIEAGDPRQASILVEGGANGVALHAPKGIAVHGDTLWVADIDVLRGSLAEGAGRWDGVEALADGRILLSSWSDSSIHVVDSAGAAPRRIVRGVPEPADIGIDTRRRRIAIPLAMSNRVELWTIPPRR